MKTILEIFIIFFLFVSPCSSQATNRLVMNVITLADAQVSSEVIKSYVKNVGGVLNLSTSDIILMTKHGVSNDVIQIVIDKNGETKRIIQKIIKEREYRESYDFYYYNYLLPRSRYYSKKQFPQTLPLILR